MSAISAANLQKDLFRYLDTAIEKNEVLSVSTQKGNVIILNAEQYQKQISAMERLEELEAIRQSDDDIVHGRVYSHEEVFAELRADAKKLMDGMSI